MEGAEQQVPAWQRQLRRPLDAGLEDIPVWHRAGFGRRRLVGGGRQAEHSCVWYLQGLLVEERMAEGQQGDDRGEREDSYR